MCEFCGCGMGRPVKRPAEERKVEKNVADMVIVAAAVEPKASKSEPSGSLRVIHTAFEGPAEDRSASRKG